MDRSIDDHKKLLDQLSTEFNRSLFQNANLGEKLSNGMTVEAYLNEAFYPSLLPALEKLSEEIEWLMSEGDRVDPRYRKRFNPVVWLSQYLMRHQKA
jgi:hypothetical protein